jgi:uncharacterized protein (TIGR00251 family)
MRPWIAAPSGLVLTVRLTPKGGRDEIQGVEQMSDGRAVLKVRVRAAPSEGEANAALMQLIAKALKVAPRAVTLTSGATARIKRLGIEGDTATLSANLEKIVGVKA